MVVTSGRLVQILTTATSMFCDGVVVGGVLAVSVRTVFVISFMVDVSVKMVVTLLCLTIVVRTVGISTVVVTIRFVTISIGRCVMWFTRISWLRFEVGV